MASQALKLAEELVKRFEGLRLAPYRDAVGFWTVGWGHLLSRDKSVPQPPAITIEKAYEYLKKDLLRAFKAVLRLCPVVLSPHQLGALTSFSFNVGAGNLELSTLRRQVLRGEHEEVPNQLQRWVYAGGVKLSGLVKRRIAEGLLYARGH